MTLCQKAPDEVERRHGRAAADAVAVARELEVGSALPVGRGGVDVDETDRLFFTPWPDEVGAKGAWIAERLGAVNAALS